MGENLELKGFIQLLIATLGIAMIEPIVFLCPLPNSKTSDDLIRGSFMLNKKTIYCKI